MQNRFQTTLMASALLALGLVAAVPANAGIGAKKVTSYIEAARSVFGDEKTAAEVVAEAAKNKASAGEIAAAVAAAQVAKEDADADVLAGIADAAGDFASRAAATIAAVTGIDIADALSDPAVADAAMDPDSVLSGADKADLKGLYDKVLAALKGAGYTAKGDGDEVAIDADSAADTAESDSDGDDAGEAADADGDAATGADNVSAGGYTGGDDNLGDPLDQTFDSSFQDPTDDSTKAPYGPHEYKPTPTTISGLESPGLVPVVTPVSAPVTPKPSKPKHTKPSPTPVGLR